MLLPYYATGISFGTIFSIGMMRYKLPKNCAFEVVSCGLSDPNKYCDIGIRLPPIARHFITQSVHICLLYLRLPDMLAKHIFDSFSRHKKSMQLRDLVNDALLMMEEKRESPAPDEN